MCDLAGWSVEDIDALAAYQETRPGYEDRVVRRELGGKEIKLVWKDELGRLSAKLEDQFVAKAREAGGDNWYFDDSERDPHGMWLVIKMRKNGPCKRW